MTLPHERERNLSAMKLPRKVVYRDEDRTEMWVPDAGGCRAFAKQLIRDGKPFKCEPCSEDGWTITVYEYNWPTRWEDDH